MNNRLENKIKSRNLVNALARTWAPTIRAAFAPFVGQKIVLATGGFSAKFLKAVTALGLPSENWQHCYISSGHGYSLTANFRVMVSNEASTSYGEVTVYLFDLSDGVVVRNDNYATHADALRVDFTSAGIIAARDAVKRARTVLSGAESALAGFGEYDN